MKLQSICYAGGQPMVFASHSSVKEAKEFFGTKVNTKKSVYVPAIGFIKLQYVI